MGIMGDQLLKLVLLMGSMKSTSFPVRLWTFRLKGNFWKSTPLVVVSTLLNEHLLPLKGKTKVFISKPIKYSQEAYLLASLDAGRSFYFFSVTQVTKNLLHLLSELFLNSDSFVQYALTQFISACPSFCLRYSISINH